MTQDMGTLLPRLAELYSAVVSDCLDQVGYRDQAMEPSIRPLYPEAKIAGIAATVLAHEVYAAPAEPYLRELEAVDRLQAGEVMVVSRVDGCYFGELLATASRVRGCRGVILDGWTRDCQRITQMRFPMFVRGISPLDSLGRMDVAAVQVPVVCGGVVVRPGDLVLADFDGVVVIPRQVAEETIARAEEKVRREDTVRELLERGESVVEVFRKHGTI